MINLSLNKLKYRLSPTVPDGTTYISYIVSIGGNQIFSGGGKYFGGRYELDCRDWIEDYINDNLFSAVNVNNITLTVVFTYSGGTSQTMTLGWKAKDNIIKSPLGFASPWLILNYSGFAYYNTSISDYDPVVVIPLSERNGYLDGKTINKLDKITSIDRYGNTHNGSTTNHYELECFVDPCWLQVETGQDLEYEKVMLALQNAKSASLELIHGTQISGMETYGTGVPGTGPVTLPVHIKDVEQVETYSSYSTDKKVPTFKITLEVFNS